jgi:EAL domain-containing protein (putative c-di-GMP-specific phosphodiesterase class I)
LSEDQGASGDLPAREAGWYLEQVGEGGQLRRVAIQRLPFRVGRKKELDLVLPADSVSKLHAEIYSLGGGLRLRDLGSKNGTFLNRTLVEDAAVHEDDILHFADFEFRIGRSDVEEAPAVAAPDERTTTVVVKRRDLPHRFVEGTRELREMIEQQRVTMVFQPIVLLSKGVVAAYEALGRGRHPKLPESPIKLFQIAESIGVEAELSRLFRRKAVELCAPRTGLPTIFLNTHPIELARPGLLESLEELRDMAPHLELALEIHEKVLTRPSAIAELRALLLERSIALAYDDFGHGQARLLEVAEAPPHYLKFDRRFVHDLDQAPVAKRRLLHSLVTLAGELNVLTVAEGIETPGEARECARLGFTYAQGFHLGRPRPIDQL